jgi:FAD synthase
MGYPTFNLDKHDLEMAHGIYLVDIQILDRKFKALMHYGPRKTFQSEISTEIYVDEHLETIPKEIKVSPIKRIRKIKKFKTKEELKKAIAEDTKYLL